MENLFGTSDSKEIKEALKFFADPKNDPLYQQMTRENTVYEDMKRVLTNKVKPASHLILER